MGSKQLAFTFTIKHNHLTKRLSDHDHSRFFFPTTLLPQRRWFPTILPSFFVNVLDILVVSASSLDVFFAPCIIWPLWNRLTYFSTATGCIFQHCCLRNEKVLTQRQNWSSVPLPELNLYCPYLYWRANLFFRVISPCCIIWVLVVVLLIFTPVSFFSFFFFFHKLPMSQLVIAVIPLISFRHMALKLNDQQYFSLDPNDTF